MLISGTAGRMDGRIGFADIVNLAKENENGQPTGEELLPRFWIEQGGKVNQIKWLEDWYAQNCIDEWEHFYGLEISTLDNPGWHVNIDLSETKYQNLVMEKIERENGENDWIVCEIVNGVFSGFGDSHKLEEILNVFINLVISRIN